VTVVPTQHELWALADEIMADIRHYYTPATLDEQHARALRSDIIRTLMQVRTEAGRAWLGSSPDAGTRR
jgi:hypothetical protein